MKSFKTYLHEEYKIKKTSEHKEDGYAQRFYDIHHKGNVAGHIWHDTGNDRMEAELHGKEIHSLHIHGAHPKSAFKNWHKDKEGQSFIKKHGPK